MPRKAKRDLQLESPLWEYYVVPTESSVRDFHIKRVRKGEQKPITTVGYFKKIENNPNIQWLYSYDYADYEGRYCTEYQIEKCEPSYYSYSSSYRKDWNDILVCEKIIEASIKADIRTVEYDRKRAEARSTYGQRLYHETRKVPPYKELK